MPKLLKPPALVFAAITLVATVVTATAANADMCGDQVVTIAGTPQADEKEGSSGVTDSIKLYEMGDWANAYGDNDNLCGNEGNDELHGGSGRDWINGGADNDQGAYAGLQGESEVDDIYGGAGNDWIYGDENNDNLHGDDGADLIFGGEGLADEGWGDAGTDSCDYEVEITSSC